LKNIENVSIVRTDIKHIDDIILIEKLCFTIPWSRNAFIQELSSNKFSIYISAMIDGKVVGYAGMWKIFDEGHITNIAVHPEYRQAGIGSMLLEGLINVAISEGITRLTLEVRKSNAAAQTLYFKYGFEIEGCRKGYYADNGEDAIIMWRNKL